MIYDTSNFHVIHNFYMLSSARNDGIDEATHTHCKLVLDDGYIGLYD